MATSKAAKTRRSDEDWESVRGRAWSRIVRATVEQVLNRSEDLTPRMREPHFREHLVLSLKHIAGDGRVPDDRPGKVWTVSGREMDRLSDAQRNQDGGSAGNAWTRWESGDYVPSEDKAEGAFGLFPGKDFVISGGEKPVKAFESGFAKLFWAVGPCWDDTAGPVPLWPCMKGEEALKAKFPHREFWLSVLQYDDGSGLPGHAVVDLLDEGVSFVDGLARSANLPLGHRPHLDPGLAPGRQLTLLNLNGEYLAQRLSSMDHEQFSRMIAVGLASQDANQLIGVGDVLLMTLATVFSAGEREDLWDQLEDPVFAALHARHGRIVKWADQFGVQGGVRRWLRRLYSDYLDKRNFACFPTYSVDPFDPGPFFFDQASLEAAMQADRETPRAQDVVDDDPEAEYLAQEDHVARVKRARPGRRTGDERLSRRRKA
ncbi:hypothetical protein [Burkholderia gladioli]|uniref:hypothetical protein n=1 Tax=Burkholderia gladioli TaxID=28095 RepID=UPI00163EC85F|nr:hypothetical protein [Burkholderia gladioli]